MSDSMVPSTLDHKVRSLAAGRPTDDAYRWGDTALTWSGYDALGDAIAERLAGMRVRYGQRAVVLLPDGGAVHAALLGCERAGVVSVGVGWRAGERELASLVAKTSPTIAIMPESTRLGAARSLCGRLGIANLITVHDGDGSPGLDEGPTAKPLQPVGPSELCMLNSTSGTTGLPKCVMQTQDRWFYFHELAAEFGELQRDEVWMSVVPAPFGFGLWTSHYSPTILGVPCVVQRKFDSRAAAELIERHRVTVLCAVSSQFAMILDQAEGLDLSSLRVLFTGGERLPIAKARAFEEATGCAVLNFYGSNETGLLSGTRVSDPLEKRIRTGGRCIPGMQVRLYDEQRHRIPGDQGIGRPACRGRATSPGYFDDDSANDELFTDDGWMLMGDIVEIDDDGWLTVIGRSADFIVRGGKNISAPAVEEEVLTHPDVAFAAAIAVPDTALGERVGICIQPRHGHSLELGDITEHLDRRGVSKEWWPEHIAVLNALPISSGGKIAKAELRARVTELFGDHGHRPDAG
ncbi:MAG: class I adenylate-forming enzyme family protein [Acidimicrobiales bacterium]